MIIDRENEVVLRIMRLDNNKEPHNFFHGIKESEWNVVVDRMETWSVASLGYHRIEKAGFSRILPSSVLQRLRSAYFQRMRYNMHLFHNLEIVLKSLSRAGIPVILLKGAHLAPAVYENIALRSMTDIDLLFKPEDMARGREVLREAATRFSGGYFPIDTHSSLYSEMEIDMTGIRERAIPVSVFETKAAGLAPEDLLVYICLHLAYRHLFQPHGLRALCDVREILAKYGKQMDWNHVLRLSENWNAKNSTMLTIRLAQDLLDAEIPDPGFIEAMENIDEDMKSWAVDQVFDETGGELTNFSVHFWALWKKGSLREKLEAARKLLFPSRRYMDENHPAYSKSGRDWGAYIIRMKKNWAVYSDVVFRYVSGDPATRKLIDRKRKNAVMRERLGKK